MLPEFVRKIVELVPEFTPTKVDDVKEYAALVRTTAPFAVIETVPMLGQALTPYTKDVPELPPLPPHPTSAIARIEPVRNLLIIIFLRPLR